jgi:hypothetical protein
MHAAPHHFARCTPPRFGMLWHAHHHTHHAQVIFRNIHKLLLDTATSEFFFCLDFFEDEGVFRDVCQPIIAIVEGDLAAAAQVRRGRGAGGRGGRGGRRRGAAAGEWRVEGWVDWS